MDKLQPRMTPNEINLFNSLLKSCKGSYFEFGGGGALIMRVCIPIFIQ